MADLGTMNVKVGADITGLLSKVDAAKAKLGQLTEENGLLKAELKDLNQSLKNNDSAIGKLNSQISKSTAITKEDRAAVAALRKERDALVSSGVKISAAIKTTTADLAINTTQLKAQTVAVKQAENAGNAFASGATKVYSGLRKLAYIIPGVGIAGLVSLISGPLIDAFSEWIETLDGVSDALKTAKANQENLNDILSSSNKEAAKQITDLKILYDAATNVNLSMKDRLAAVKGLQNEFPDYFKNIKTEAILNGEAKVSYDAAADSILRMARAKAAVNKLQDIGAKQLDNDIQRQKILNATANEAARAQDRVLKQQTTGSSLTGGGAGSSQVTITRAEQLKIIEARRDAALKIVDINAKSLKEQADFITKFIGLSDLAKSVETEIKTPKVKKDAESIKHVETISDVIAKMNAQIDVLNKKEILQNVSLAPEKVKVVEKAIDELLTKFKLLTDDPHIIELQAKIADFNLTEQFKKDALNRKNEKLEVPIEFKPESKPDYQAFDTERYKLIQRLKDFGVTKTKIGIPIDTANNKELQDTLDETLLKLKNISDFTVSTLSPAFDALFEGILSGSQNAFQSFGQALQQTIVQLGAAVLKAAAFAAILSAINPDLTFKSAFKNLLGFSSGGSVKGFATGGYIDGPGTKTSDSILARLSRGEFVIKADTVSKFGVGFFEKLNRGLMPKFDSFGFAKFATGGFVSPNIIRTSQVPSMSGIAIGGGQTIQITGDFQLRNDRLVAAVRRGNAQITRNT
jgi:hypothetical protein